MDGRTFSHYFPKMNVKVKKRICKVLGRIIFWQTLTFSAVQLTVHFFAHIVHNQTNSKGKKKQQQYNAQNKGIKLNNFQLFLWLPQVRALVVVDSFLYHCVFTIWGIPGTVYIAKSLSYMFLTKYSYIVYLFFKYP